MKFCIPTTITIMTLSFCSAAVDVALRGSVAHENDIAELDLAMLNRTLDGTSTDANRIVPFDEHPNIYCATYRATYAIRSIAHNTYISAHPSGKVNMQKHARSYERFTFQWLGLGLYSIKSVHGTYLRTKWTHEKFRHVNTQKYVGSKEKFKLEVSENGAHSIRSNFYTTIYLRACPDRKLSLQTYKSSWEKFELVCLLPE